MIINNILKRLNQMPILFLLILVSINTTLRAEGSIKPFILSEIHKDGDLQTIVSAAREKLKTAQFEILGQYAPYQGAEIIIFTDDIIRQTATQSKRGGYGGALRLSVTTNDDKIELSYTNPIYWANSFRLNNDLEFSGKKLRKAFGFINEFGTGGTKLTAKDMRQYHYTFMMEYFDDPSILSHFESHKNAIDAVNKNLASNIAGSSEVFQLHLGKDSEGKEMTLFGVALTGENDNECSGDQYIMDQIDRSSPRHTAHLPYEILVYGNNVEALYARFRIAISWPHLPMMSSDTGATFFSIMCAPGSIEKALTEIAGGKLTNDFEK
jgi:hypothetical protein